MIPFVSSVAGAFFSFLGAKAVNQTITTYQEYASEDAPITAHNPRSFPTDPNCEDYLFFLCEMPSSENSPLQERQQNCTEKVATTISYYLKQIGYTVTTVGGAVCGAAYSTLSNTEENQDTLSLTGIYWGCIAMLLGTLAVAQATLRYPLSSDSDEDEEPLPQTRGHSTTVTPAILSPQSSRTIIIYGSP